LERGLAPQKPRVISWVVFFSALTVVLITLISVVFPAFVNTRFGGFPNYSNINPFEIGIWAWQLLVTNAIVFSFAFLYFKNKLPRFVTRSIRFIFNFEISKRIALISILVILGIFVSFAVQHLSAPDPWGDYSGIRVLEQKWKIDGIGYNGMDYYVKYFLLFLSLKIFGNDRVVPLLVSISLLVLIYFLTSTIAKKRFAGIVALVIVLQSSLFLTYYSSPTYENSWTLFYVLSLYMIIKKWPLSPISYVLSLFSKSFTGAFFPMTFFFIYESPISRKNKIWVLVSYAAIVVILISGFLFYKDFLLGELREFNSHDFWQGFTAFSFEFRHDGLILLFILPLIVGLGVASKKGILYSDSILVLITWIFLLSSLLLAFTTQTNQPYRFMPLVMFFSIGVGTLLSKNFRKEA